MFNPPSQASVESILTDIRSGNTEYADQFLAARPDWQEDDKQADKAQEKKEEVKA